MEETVAVWKLHCPSCLAKGIHDSKLAIGRELCVQAGDQIRFTCGNCKNFFIIDIVSLQSPENMEK